MRYAGSARRVRICLAAQAPVEYARAVESLEISAKYRAVTARTGLISCQDFLKYFSPDKLAGQTTVFVKPAELSCDTDAPIAVFYKQYEYRTPSWRFLGRASKAWREFQSYAAFERMGIACAEPIAAGEMRDWLGRLKRAFIVTRAVPKAKTLIEFFQQVCADRKSVVARELRAALLRQLAGMTRRLHDQNYVHTDLYWRNILVTQLASGEPVMWWIDCPRGRFRRFYRRAGRIKDLASLDKGAAKFCTRGERVAFVKHYLGKTKLDAEGKRWIRDTLTYRQQRWPDDGH